MLVRILTVDDIHPALPVFLGMYHNSHSLGSLRQCRSCVINGTLSLMRGSFIQELSLSIMCLKAP